MDIVRRRLKDAAAGELDVEVLVWGGGGALGAQGAVVRLTVTQIRANTCKSGDVLITYVKNIF